MLGVAEECFGLWESVYHQRSAAEIAHLTFAQQQDQRSTLAITHGVELGVQPTPSTSLRTGFGAPDTSGNRPFLKGWPLFGAPLDALHQSSTG